MSVWTILGPVAPFKGGVAQHTTELAHRLAARGDDVVVESWHRQYPKRLYPGDTQTADGDYPPYERVVRQLSWNRPDTWWRVARRIRHRGGRLILVGVTPFQYPIYLVILAAIGRSHRETSVLIAHNVVPHEASRLDRLLTRSLVGKVGIVLAHSDDERRNAEDLGANAVSARLPLHFNAAPPALQHERSTDLLAFIGFVRPYKGLDVLLRALATSPSRMRLEVLGEFWTDIDDVRALIDECRLTERCALRPGYADSTDVVELLDRCSALVLPYRSATSSQLPRIAFSRGTPVITTNVGDLGQQIRDGVDGIVCDPSVESLAAAITEISDPRVQSALGQAVRVPTVDDEWAAYVTTLTGVGS